MSSTATPSEKPSPQRRGTMYGVDNRMGQLLETGDLSDVQFSVGRHVGKEKIFRAHKCVLVSSSDVFYTMFCGSSPGMSNDTIDVPDISPQAFERMLKYIYTDETDVTVEDAFPTMKCAEKFELQWLADHCFDFVLSDLHQTSGNCLRHLENALMWAADNESVMENCWHFVDIYCEEILKSERFTELPSTTLRMILQRDTLLAEENIIYMAVDRWATALCARSNLEPTPQNRRHVLGDIFFLIRFPLMTDTQLADGPLNDLFLLPTELTDIYLRKHATAKRPLRFFTQPRRLPVIRVGDLEFKHKEEVFASDGGFSWSPALMIGTQGTKVRCESLRDDLRGRLMWREPADIIRASDIFVAGSDILYGDPIYFSQNAKYSRLENGSHTILMGGKK
ncbi:BTB/POZ domain-containing protein 6-like, partial [Paramacrobiotus metropolitanus]|uniref:BTB/POZ domain-containing protein 6-like n=1 Tax=Paramacrobiotus metropolitanus TaxID=2943436 RepID=UPI0024456735